MQPVYFLCGVPGSGKTWVSSQLSDKFYLVLNDDYIGQPNRWMSDVYRAARAQEKPVLCDCPFREREVRDNLVAKDLNVIPVFIVEDPQIVKRRYEARELKPVRPEIMTRALSIKSRAREWHAFFGTSEEVLKHLKEV